jgi:hypothetical protein
MGPPPRSFADDAHDCIMVAIRTRIDPNTRLWRDFRASMASSPSDQVVPIFRLQDYSCQ